MKDGSLLGAAGLPELPPDGIAIVRLLADDADVALVYVTHREDEVEALAFENVLQLDQSVSK